MKQEDVWDGQWETYPENTLLCGKHETDANMRQYIEEQDSLVPSSYIP